MPSSFCLSPLRNFARQNGRFAQGNALPGISDSWQSFELVLPHLPASLHAFALSLRGHGDSSRPAAGYHPRDLAADVAAFLDALHLNAVVIGGHSLGSLAARRFAIDCPERTLGLVLIGSFLAMHGNPAVTAVYDLAWSLTEPVDPATVRDFQGSTLARPVPAAFFETAVQESLKVPPRVWRAAMTGVAQNDSPGEFHKIKAPTLMVVGDRDEMCPYQDQEAIAVAIPDTRLVVYPGIGHALHWEEPERFASDLVTFIETTIRPARRVEMAAPALP
jgi:non-heme chloroperoxidase